MTGIAHIVNVRVWVIMVSLTVAGYGFVVGIIVHASNYAERVLVRRNLVAQKKLGKYLNTI